MSTRKDLARVKEVLVRNGWRKFRHTGSNHEMWVSSDGSRMWALPSGHKTMDPRAIKNLQADLRKRGVRF